MRQSFKAQQLTHETNQSRDAQSTMPKLERGESATNSMGGSFGASAAGYQR